MRTRKILTFGVISGAIWSLFPGLASEFYRKPIDIIPVTLAGILTGISISYLLYFLNFKKYWFYLFGALISLPISGALFGIYLNLCRIPFPLSKARDLEYFFNDTLQLSILYSIYWVWYPIAIIAVPACLITLFFLKWVSIVQTPPQNA